MTLSGPPPSPAGARPPLRRRRPSPWRRRLSRWDTRLSPYLYISPFFVLFLLVGMFPLGYTAWVSVHEWGLLSGQGDFIGLDNYARVIEDRYFWNALRNTVSIFVLSSVPQVVIALVLAALLDTQLRGRTLWRMSVLIPFVVAPAAVALIFGNVFGDRYGLVNEGLQAIGLEPIRWHVEHPGQPRRHRVDGQLALDRLQRADLPGRHAGRAARALRVGLPRRRRPGAAVPLHHLPMIRPTLLFVIITSTIGGLQIFAEPRLFDTQGLGGSDRQYQTLTMYLWELGWRVRDLGMASAVAWLLFLIIIVFALVNLVISRRVGALGGRR